MHPRRHLTTAPTGGLPTAGARTAHPRPALVAGRDVDEREAAARAASMARHPAGNRARVVGEQRAATLARHPAGGAPQPLREV